eukprot:m51a1_g6609 hypothetical protein (309) ;mRNA; f:16660-17808
MSESKWIPYAERPEWADITPVQQYPDVPAPVCGINYGLQFRETMSYFRAILRKDERSRRAYEICREAIDLNSANYTAWYYRRLCVEALNEDWRKELELAEEVAEDNPKNYQLWYHRQVASARLGEGSAAAELAFCERMIADDSKNYHAWAHRQWVLETAPALLAGELAYVDALLEQDPRNNSAWNHRYFVLARTAGAEWPSEVVERELQYAADRLRPAPNNESPWSYMRGVAARAGGVGACERVRAVALEYAAKCPACPHCLSMLADIYEARADSVAFNEVAEKLRDSVDTIRRRYWEYRMASFSRSQ